MHPPLKILPSVRLRQQRRREEVLVKHMKEQIVFLPYKYMLILCQGKGVMRCTLRLLLCLLQVKRRTTCHHLLGRSVGI